MYTHSSSLQITLIVISVALETLLEDSDLKIDNLWCGLWIECDSVNVW